MDLLETLQVELIADNVRRGGGLVRAVRQQHRRVGRENRRRAGALERLERELGSHPQPAVRPGVRDNLDLNDT